MFAAKNLMCNVNPMEGRYLCGAALFRGNVSTYEVEKSVKKAVDDSKLFIEWIPDSIKTSVCNVPPPGLKSSATFLGNSTAF